VPAGLPAGVRPQHVRHHHQPDAGRSPIDGDEKRWSTTASTPRSRSSSSCWQEETLLARALEAGGAMAEFLLGASAFVLAMVALGLARILRGRTTPIG